MTWQFYFNVHKMAERKIFSIHLFISIMKTIYEQEIILLLPHVIYNIKTFKRRYYAMSEQGVSQFNWIVHQCLVFNYSIEFLLLTVHNRNTMCVVIRLVIIYATDNFLTQKIDFLGFVLYPNFHKKIRVTNFQIKNCPYWF